MKKWWMFWLVSLPIAVSAQAPFTDWSAITPGGNEINNYNEKTLILSNGQKLPYLKRWYFYRGYIIGEREGDRGYFLANERTRQIDTYEREQAWKQDIAERELNPKFLTRWHDSSWVLFGHPDTFFLGLVAIPIYLIFTFIVFLFAFFKAKFRIRHPFTQILAFMIAIISLVYLFDTLPQSI